MAATADSRLPNAVITTTGTSGRLAAILLAERDTVDAGHRQVGDDHVELLVQQPFERPLRVGLRDDIVEPLLQPELERLAELGIVVDNEHAGHGPSITDASGAAGK